MEIDDTLFNKLKYIDDIQTKTKAYNKKNDNEDITELSFTGLKGREYKLLKYFCKKFSIESESLKHQPKDDKELLNLARYEQTKRKLKLLHGYINLFGFVFMLRYIDMILIVKRGGFYFSLISCLFFYNMNKFFTKYKHCENFKNIAMIQGTSPTKLLEKIKKENNEKYKDKLMTKNALNKYWKEPMAWH